MKNFAFFRGNSPRVAPVGFALALASLFSSGSSTAQTQTIQQRIDAAASGATVSVPSGIYREKVTINKPLTLSGASGAEIRGSDVWTGWTQSGSTWVSANVVPGFGGNADNGSARSGWPEQVFLNGLALKQVASNPNSGEFALDATRHVILRDAPGGKTVEVTTRDGWIFGPGSATSAADGVTIKGFTMKHSANLQQGGALDANKASFWTVQDCVLSDAHGAVFSFGEGHDSKLLRCDIARGGQLGVHGGSGNLLVQGCRIHDNNTEEFNVEWEAGGLKIAVANNVTLDGNEAFDNRGPGLWLDIAADDAIIKNNRVYRNTYAGIWFEVSDGAQIFNNVTWMNGFGKNTYGWGAGILISCARNAEVYNNVAAWDADGISVISINRDHDWPAFNVVSGNNVHNNQILMANFDLGDADIYHQDALGWKSNWGGAKITDPALNNRGADNRYWYGEAPDTPGRGPRFEWGSSNFRGIANFNATPGEENGRYLSDAEKNQVVLSARVPSGPSLIFNPNFERALNTAAPVGASPWVSSGANTAAAYTEGDSPRGRAYSGGSHGTHYLSSAYQVTTSQTISGLPNGSYTLLAWVRSSGGQTTARLTAGSASANLNTAISDWKQIVLENVTVSNATSGSNGSCTISFSSNAGAGQWLQFDDVFFFGGQPHSTPSGTYKLIARHSGRVLTVDLNPNTNGGVSGTAAGANVFQYDYVSDFNNKQWVLQPLADGAYKLTARHSGKVLEVKGGPTFTANGVNVDQWDFNSGTHQQWWIQPVGDGYYRLLAKHSGKALDVQGGGTANGVNVYQWEYTGVTNQQWRLELLSNSTQSGTTAPLSASVASAAPSTQTAPTSPSGASS